VLRTRKTAYEFLIVEKSHKEYFPLELRRVLSVKAKGTESILHTCITRKDGKSGGELKKIVFEFYNETLASSWSAAVSHLVFGGY
jgi:hypothetical protein